MSSLQKFFALSAAALLTACASTGGLDTATSPAAKADEHAAHQAQDSASTPMAAMEPRMKAMREMHEKMMNAKTPEERNALMGDHMKAMQDGMSMMKGMGAMGAPGGMAMPADMARHQQMMAHHMDMMQLMMAMMTDRLPPQPAAPARN